MKSLVANADNVNAPVAPRAGAWIEIHLFCFCISAKNVAPRAGAWIEINWIDSDKSIREVAPRAGAWIEMTWTINH